MDPRTHAVARSTLAKLNGRAVDEHCELKNEIVTLTSMTNLGARHGIVNGEIAGAEECSRNHAEGVDFRVPRSTSR
jgi:hypothetical protein